MRAVCFLHLNLNYSKNPSKAPNPNSCKPTFLNREWESGFKRDRMYIVRKELNRGGLTKNQLTSQRRAEAQAMPVASTSATTCGGTVAP